ncbi:MAG TPA: acetate uptake transporter [Thermoleophilia bacterium]|nr:acetate uptake transporter [Thermoleophilia bacterium]
MTDPQHEVLATVKDKVANPAPLGLMAFGITTVLLNLHNAGLFGMSTMILAMAVFYGGLAQVIVAVQEYKKNNVFGATAFASYGLFWLTFVGMLAFPKWMGIDGPTSTAVGWYLLSWGVFTGLMFIATLRINVSLQVVFGSLTILYVLLALSEWTGNATLLKVAGWEGVFVGLSAMYGSIAQIWNEVYGHVVLPLGQVQRSRSVKVMPSAQVSGR